VLKGKVSYMSPEYARGQGFDRRSDLYSTAVVLFELATGVRPFTADHELELLRLVAEVEPPPIATFAPSFDKNLADLIHRMLAKDPAARPANGEEVEAELDRWLVARGYDSAGLERTLAAFVERHAADRKADVARLLDSPGEPAGDRPRSPARTRTLTVLLGSESMNFLGVPKRASGGDEGPTTRPLPPKPARREPHTRALVRPSTEPRLGAGAGGVHAEPVTDIGSEDVRTLPLTRKGDRVAPRLVDDETDTGLVAPRGGSAVPPSLPAPARTRLIAAGVASFVIVASTLFALLAVTRKRPPTEMPAAAQATSAAVETAPALAPPAPPPATADPVPASSASPAESASAVPAVASGASSAGHKGRAPATKRRCTPADFDYPRCLPKPR